MKYLFYSLAFLSVFLLPSFALADYTITTATASNQQVSATAFASNNLAAVAVPFTTIGAGTATLTTVSLSINAGSPTGGVKISLEADSGGVPSNTILSSGSVATVTGSCTTYSVSSFTPFALTAATKYWLVFNRVDGTFDSTNRYGVCGDSTGEFWRLNTSWEDQGASSGSLYGVLNITTAAATTASKTIINGIKFVIQGVKVILN